MEVHRRDFPTLLLDNDEVFLDHLCGVIESVDELASVEITKSSNKFHFRIAPSIAKYMEPILYEVLKFSNMFSIHLDLSKSMKVSSTVTFEINIS